MAQWRPLLTPTPDVPWEASHPERALTPRAGALGRVGGAGRASGGGRLPGPRLGPADPGALQKQDAPRHQIGDAQEQEEHLGPP